MAFFAGFLSTAFGSLHPFFLRSVEFPLSCAERVAVDERGRIYVGLTFYGRIQVYDEAGSFLHGFFLERGVDGQFEMWWEDGNLHVVGGRDIRHDEHHVYDTGGQFLSRRYIAEDSVPPFRQWPPAMDAEGRKYRIRSRYWDPKIQRTEHGTYVTVIETPVFLKPFIGPLPCWSVVMLIAVLRHLTPLIRKAIELGRKAAPDLRQPP